MPFGFDIQACWLANMSRGFSVESLVTSELSALLFYRVTISRKIVMPGHGISLPAISGRY
jgi:hypothetical protein